MSPKEVEVQEKKELEQAEERTQSGRYYVPYTDIHEAEDTIIVTMDVPGVDRERIDVSLEKNVLTVSAKVDTSSYDGLEPVYTEYNVGNYGRSFSISSEVDRDAISANVANGVLTLRLPKQKDASARRIQVN